MKDDLSEKGFINKDKILEYVSEEEIYALVFDFIPMEYEYTISPFREDRNPGCWFERDINGVLRFIDFGNPEVISNIKMAVMDCFNAVQIFYNLPNFYKTLSFIKERLITGKGVTKAKYVKDKLKKKKKRKVDIHVETRNFTAKDGRFWSKYGISKQNLIDDKVFPILKYKLLNTKFGDVLIRPERSSYVYTDFMENRKKIYAPYDKKKKFTTNCVADDVGGLRTIAEFGKQLIITKSYKDYRVLKNEGLEVIWFQNEGMIPNENILIDLGRRYRELIIFFDNDSTGLLASRKVNVHINRLFKDKARIVHLPIQLEKFHITDPSDLYHKQGRIHLQKFLKENL